MLSLRFKALFISFAIAGLCNLAANALTRTECTDEQYLNHHGHSDEIIRLVNLQKARLEDKEMPAVNKRSKFRTFMSDIYDNFPIRYQRPFGDDKIEIK